MVLASVQKALWLARPVIVVVVLSIVAYFVIRPSMEEEQQGERIGQAMFRAIALLSADKIAKMDVYDNWYDGHLLTEIADKEALKEFVSGLQKAWLWVPNHPSFRREFYVVLRLEGGEQLEYQMGIHEKQIVYIYLVSRNDNRLSYYGRAQSDALYGWFAVHGLLGPS